MFYHTDTTTVVRRGTEQASCSKEAEPAVALAEPPAKKMNASNDTLIDIDTNIGTNDGNPKLTAGCLLV